MFASVQRSARGVVGMAVLTGVAVLGGCGNASTGSNGRSGSVTVALATTGSDGATYQFTSGTFLETFNSTTGFNAFFPIDGAETVLTETVPVGAIQRVPEHPGGAPLQLVRTLNGMSQTVAATWTDSQPFTFNIMQNLTSPIVLHFAVVGLGDITFQVGRLQVAIDVSSTTTTMPTTSQESATLAISSQTLAPGLGLETPLGLTVGEVDRRVDHPALTGPSAEQSGVRLRQRHAERDSSAPSSSAAFSALVEELTGTPASGASICVFDDGATDIVELEVARFGVAPADQQAFLPGSNYEFFGLVEFDAGDIYDGTTLKLSQLEGPITLNAANFAFWDHSIFDSAPASNWRPRSAPSARGPSSSLRETAGLVIARRLRPRRRPFRAGARR